MAEGDTTPGPTKKVQYWPAFDGIRGIGMALVLMYHWLFSWTGGFFYGLTPFFALSGFLITTLLLSERERAGKVDFKRFYQRRAYRLLPALFTMLTLYLIVDFFLLHDVGRWLKSVVWALIGMSYVTNFALIAHVTELGELVHLWSLAVEEQFYLIWPPILLLLLRRGVAYRTLAWGCVAAFVGSGLIRWWTYQGPTNTHHAQYGFDTRGGEILIGCAVALLIWDMRGALSARGAQLLRIAGHVAFVTIALHMVFPLNGRTHQLTEIYPYRLGFSVVAFCAAILVANIRLTPGSWWQWILEIPVFTHLGKISYGLYLFHLPIFRLMAIHTDLEGAPLHLLQFGLSVVAGELSFRYVEEPWQRRRDRARVTANTSPQSPDSAA